MNSAVRVVCRRSWTVGLFNGRGRLLLEYPPVINWKLVKSTSMPQQRLYKGDAGCIYLSTDVLTGSVEIGVMVTNETFIYHSVARWFGGEYAAWIEITRTVYVNFIPSMWTYKLYGHGLINYFPPPCSGGPGLSGDQSVWCLCWTVVDSVSL